MLANLTEFGKTPLFTLGELRSAGVAIALYPLGAFRAMSRAAEGCTGRSAGAGRRRSVVGAMQTRAELYDVLGYEEYERRLDRLRGRGRREGTSMSKKSVALSGVVAGNTAICTVGHTGNDLHYRGYDIGELAREGEPTRRSRTC